MFTVAPWVTTTFESLKLRSARRREPSWLASASLSDSAGDTSRVTTFSTCGLSFCSVVCATAITSTFSSTILALAGAMPAAPCSLIATSTSTRACGSTKPAMSETSSTATDMARMSGGTTSDKIPAVSPANSRAGTMGSFSIISALTILPKTVCGWLVAPAGMLSRGQRITLTSPASSLVPIASTRAATTTSVASSRAF